jgi:hypothetical protein
VTLALPELSELAWDRVPAPREGEIVVRDLSTSLLDLSKTEVVSDTGELRRDWLSGVHVVDAPAIQGVQGRVGGRKLSLSTIRFEIETPAASVIVVSLDGRSLAESARMLVTAAARVGASAADSLPLLAEPVTGRLVFSTNQPLKFTPLAPDSEYDPATGRGRPETATRAHAPKDGVVGLALTREHASHWYLVERVEN